MLANLLWNWLLCHIRAIAEGYCFTFCTYLIRLLLCLSKLGSLPAQDPCQPKIPVSPRSQSTQDPSQPKIPVNPRSQSAQDPSQLWMPSCLLSSCLFGSCLFGIWLMPISYLDHAYLLFCSCLFGSWLMRNLHQLNSPIPTWISVICIWHMHIFPV